MKLHIQCDGERNTGAPLAALVIDAVRRVVATATKSRTSFVVR